jgi:hypothetical protein
LLPVITLNGLTNGKKYHARLVAKNEDHRSAAGPEYPLYITEDPPPSPDGLRVELSAGSASLTWGEVLGITEYRVYRRKKGEPQFTAAYRGRATTWKDMDYLSSHQRIHPRTQRAAIALLSLTLSII